MRLIKSILILSAGFFVILYAGVSLRFGIWQEKNAGRSTNKTPNHESISKNSQQERTHIPAKPGKE